MSQPISFGSIEIGLARQLSSELASARRDDPFWILVLGDFSGRRTRCPIEIGPALAKRKPVVVDRDSIDQLPGNIGTQVLVNVAGAPLALTFKDLDDFRPDAVFDHVELFEHLRQLRRRLLNPMTADAAAQEIRDQLARTKPSSEKREESSAAASLSAEPGALGSDLVAELLEATSSRERRPANEPDWNAVIGEIVRPHLSPAIRPDTESLLAVVDSAVSNQMRQLIHAPAFADTEAAWRGLSLLIRRVDDDSRVRVALFDISMSELLADLSSTEDLAQSGLFKLLVERNVGAPDGRRWGALVVDFQFDPSREHVEALGRLVQMSSVLQSPVMTNASVRWLGCEDPSQMADPDDWRMAYPEDVAQGWKSLRERPEAKYLAFSLPRYLVRPPHGAKTSPSERFAFEEVEGIPQSSDYLWGNASYLLASLLGSAFEEEGWRMRPGSVQQLDRLNVHVFERDGDSELTCCLEGKLTIRGAERALTLGLLPVLLAGEGDSARVPVFQSASSAGERLSGRWSP